MTNTQAHQCLQVHEDIGLALLVVLNNLAAIKDIFNIDTLGRFLCVLKMEFSTPTTGCQNVKQTKECQECWVQIVVL